MKILNLRFANLNSLEGEWEIDFTRPEYLSDGIFAITGPTGSGKSTILDALCLALYGQTPRLGKVTRGGNEIMSRHAGDCFAEATFSTLQGSFRCHWSQHRARRRPGGELQAQKHEIADAVSGQLLQTRLQDTLAAVETATGMDFDRFTRSMLLAQGGFAAFLQADPDRRAPVLEQITGTEVYSLISVRVHERQRDERAKLELLRSEAGSLRLLGQEEAASLRSAEQVLLTEESSSAAHLEAAKEALRRHDTIGRLRGELAEIDRISAELEHEAEAFKPDAGRLARASQAAALETPYASLQHQRKELARESEELAESERRRPELQASVELEQVKLEQATRALHDATEAESLARPLHERVRSLDRSISEKRQAYDTVGREAGELERAVASMETELDGLASGLELKRQELEDTVRRLRESAADAGLASELSGIRIAVAGLRDSASRAASALSEKEEASVREAAGLSAKSASEKEAGKAAEALRISDEALSALKGELASLTGGKGLKTMRLELEGSKALWKLLEEISELYSSGREFAPKIAQASAEIEGLEAARGEAELRLEHARGLLAGAERAAVLTEQNLHLAARVRDFEEERRRLADGEACPLCGSKEHPYLSGTTPVEPLDEACLAEARRTVQQHAGDVRDLEMAITKYAERIGQRRLRLAELEHERETYGRRCVGHLHAAGITASPRDAEPAVQEALEASKTAVGELEALVVRVESLGERIDGEERKRQALLEAKSARELGLANAAGRLAAASADHIRMRAAHELAQRDLRSRMEELRERLEPYGVSMDLNDDATAIVAGLASRAERRSADETKQATLESGMLADQASIAVAGERLSATRRELESKRTAVAGLDADLGALSRERTALFGELDPSVEAERMAKALDAARRESEQARDAHDRSSQAIRLLDAAIQALEASIVKRKPGIETREAEFLESLRSRGFDGEQAFAAARLQGGALERLAAAADTLRQKGMALAARRQDRDERLAMELEGLADSRGPEELSMYAATLQEAIRLTREKVGAIRQRFEENDRLAGEQRRMAEAIEAQAAESRRWEMLHELIGSADGKKFRNFAQGLTFEIMVAHANRQLASMTDRYLLVRDRAVPLELNVVDTWQAGEVRSTRNLSGGESFIVSLALALGLSQMSSRNVRVDSLFLDEGFGTLDEEALETALETLAGLQQTGKLIGIISHVSALKERISTRIRVRPLTGGRSSLHGPGVTRR